jgi:hypothetical protein
MDAAMKKLFEKKKDSDMTPEYKGAKMSMLKELKDQMQKLMANGLQDSKLKKVEIMSTDKEGLEAGLDKAKDVVEDLPELGAAPAEEGAEEEEDEEFAGMKPEQIDAMIAKLQAMKAKC